MSVLIDSSITIYEALQNIKNGKYVMPAFQRQYVWSMEQIEKLWDSILLDYPIATFLFGMLMMIMCPGIPISVISCPLLHLIAVNKLTV